MWRKNQPTAQHLPSRPILLVHGYLNSGFVWDFHKNRLARAGIGPIYTIDLGYPFHSIRTYAEKVRDKAQQIAKETGRNDLTLIGHSMGGLVSYYYATHMAQGSVSEVITIASPLRGTHVAKIGLGQCAREMQIGSEFIQELQNAAAHSPHIRFYNIATQTDELVVPYTSSIFQSEPHRQFFIEDVGHASLLFSERVSDQLCKWLKDADLMGPVV
jgi:triacylglycerol lipase